VAKLDQRLQTLEERQPKLTISKTTMMGLLAELPIMALSDFEKFDRRTIKKIFSLFFL
jgi:hypothetical protein